MSGEWFGFLMEKLFEKNALDVWYTPIYMKKNRPAVQISVLCKASDEDELVRVLLKETTTLGVRSYEVERTILERKTLMVNTIYGDIAVKIAQGPGILKGAPEYEDCKKAAEQHNVPIQMVYDLVMREFWKIQKFA